MASACAMQAASKPKSSLAAMTGLTEIFHSADHGWHSYVAFRFFAPLVICFSVGVAGASARAGDAREHDRIYVNIPAQPLAAALDAYCAAAGLQMFVDTASIAGRRSVAVVGEFTREGALQGLLSGTALAARFVGNQGFTLVSLSSPGADVGASRSPSIESRRFAGYSALLQTGLRKALCRSEETRPGTYRFLGRLWIGARGTISRAELITSTGDGVRDAALLSALQDVAIGEAPPPGLPQPVTLLLAADTTLAAEYCAGSPTGVQPIKPATGARH